MNYTTRNKKFFLCATFSKISSKNIKITKIAAYIREQYLSYTIKETIFTCVSF